MFRSSATLAPLYEALSRQAVLAVKAEQVWTFLGKKLDGRVPAEIDSHFNTRIEGTCIKHRWGVLGQALRQVPAGVAHRDHHPRRDLFQAPPPGGTPRRTWARELAPLRKSIYSLIDLREILLGCNRRYLEFLSSLDDPSRGARDLKRLCEPKSDGERTIKGLNFFSLTEQALLRALERPEFNIHGLRRANLKSLLPQLSDAAPSRQLRRAAMPRSDQARCAFLSLLPDTPGSRRDRRRMFVDRVQYRAGFGSGAMRNSLPFLSTMKS